MATTPSLSDVIDLFVSKGLEGVHVAMPGVVVAYDPATQKATVQPSVPLCDDDGTPRPIPPLGGVPVVFPSGGGYRFMFPLAPGDPVLVVFGSNSMEDWLVRGGLVELPASKRRHGLSDAVAFPGLSPFGQRVPSVPTALEVGGATTKIVVTEGGKVQLGSEAAVDPVALSTANDANWSAFDAWAGAVQTILSGLGVPVPTPWAGAAPTAATKVDGI